MGGAAAKGSASAGLKLPLRSDELGEVSCAESEPSGTPADGDRSWRAWADCLLLLACDVAASIVFWYVLGMPSGLPSWGSYACLAALALAMSLWRLLWWRAAAAGSGAQIPYSCGFVEANGKELFLVATMHISPRAPLDVQAVISATKPDIAMIELDEERLDRLRDVELQRKREPKSEDLQPIRIAGGGAEPATVLAQRALWNAEKAGEAISGDVVFDTCNPYGLTKLGAETDGRLALLRRGGPEGQVVPFALKAHHAAGAGARAVLVINHEDRLPVQRIGAGALANDLRLALQTCNCGFPRVPVLLLPKAAGEELAERCAGPGSGVRAEFEVLEDAYPRRTLPLRLCQGCALLASGIGILYGIIQCFDVEVGAEFTQAEVAATAQGIPCACIDVDMNRFWARLAAAALPTPCNLAGSLRAWLAFPRVLTRVLFPPRGNVDIVGSMLLHLASFPARTWLAFGLAAFGATTVASGGLRLLGLASERGAEAAGAVDAGDRNEAQAWIMLLAEAYLLPQVYQAVAASRDEAMYRSIVATSCERKARRLVAVVGAGHANGILRLARTRGL